MLAFGDPLCVGVRRDRVRQLADGGRRKRPDGCRVPHNGYSISGQLLVRQDDGTEIEINPGDAYSIDPGHDAEVVGDEPRVGVDFSSVMAAGFAKPN